MAVTVSCKPIGVLQGFLAQAKAILRVDALSFDTADKEKPFKVTFAALERPIDDDNPWIEDMRGK